MIVSLALTMVMSFEPGHQQESYIFAKFQEFLTKENKKYSTIEEYMARFRIFKNNYLKLESFSISADSDRKYSVALNKFADLTPQEFRRTYLNLDIKLVNTIKAKSDKFTLLEDNAFPASHDWRSQGAVGQVKDQGSCGSCWAFSTVGNLEGLNYIATKTFTQFSEQQLVDCDGKDSGCQGGLMENAFQYLQEVGGIEKQGDYIYTGREGSCAFNKEKVALKVTGWESAGEDEKKIKEFLYNTGPLSVALNADTLQFYQGGIITASAAECDPEGLNHGVTLVGYGSENGTDFWIVRNSWGSAWGEEGYFRIQRGAQTCGINKYVVSAKIN